MVVDDVDVGWAVGRPTEDDAPLVVDADGVETAHAALQRLETVAGRVEELVHKATKDLWSFKKDGDNYVIERLFDESGNPLKV